MVYVISGFLKKIKLIQYNKDDRLFGKYKNNTLYLLKSFYVDDTLIEIVNKESTTVASKIKYKYKVSMDKTANKIIRINIIKTNKGYKCN